MSRTSISERTKLRVWLAAGGRCQYPGCNAPLWRDELTLAQMNRAYLAHIVGDRETGPRGDPHLSMMLADAPSNLMLLCDVHHRLIDRDAVEEHPAELLLHYKQEHAERIERQTAIQTSRKTHVLLFGSRIGSRSGLVNEEQAREAVLAEGRYPATDHGIRIDLADGPIGDADPAYWAHVARYVEQAVERYLRPGVGPTGKEINHLSVFALAPIPALIHFGRHLGDIISADVFQRHRSPSDWTWRPFEHEGFNYTTLTPDEEYPADAVAVNLSLSGRVHEPEIEGAMGRAVPTYTLTIASPSRTFLQAKEQLELFRTEWRGLLARIRGVHGTVCEIHLFPAVPNAVAVEVGRLLLPKVDPPLLVYDCDREEHGFRYALTV
jgi:hypothetical protein